jgi:glycosyltransferase involved in cell wall biosynthesis
MMISVVIPAFNEGDAVGDTVTEVRKALTNVEYEVLVVDDGSNDATAKRAEEAGAAVIRHPHNLGYGSALKTGIRAARYDVIVITDADGTYPNEQIMSLVDEYSKGFNMVVGARTGSHYKGSFLKGLLRMVLKFLVEFTTGRSIPDINSGFRIFSQKEIIPYYNHLCNTFSFTTSLTLAYMMTSKFVAYLPIPYHKRKGSSTKVRLFRDMLRTLQYIVQAILYYNPLKIFILMSGMIAAGSIISLIIATIFRSMSAFYLGIGGILIVVLVFCLGLLAELLKQIMAGAGKEGM